jgi:hypothetical protein
MDQEFNISIDNAMRQSALTAEDYLSKAYKILDDTYDEWSIRDAIELAKIMAADFHTSMMCLKLQEIRDNINIISHFKNEE